MERGLCGDILTLLDWILRFLRNAIRSKTPVFNDE
jgi:hypothetical protein